jgi:hypothetical protein
MDIGDVNDLLWMRLLECWLPLIQEMNLAQGWGYDAPSLEALILVAAPGLSQTRNVLEAWAVLWHYHRLARRRDR